MAQNPHTKMESFVELWDYPEHIDANCNEAVDIVSKVVDYFKERMNVEKSYTKSMRKLHKDFLKKLGHEDTKKKNKVDTSIKEVNSLFSPLMEIWQNYLQDLERSLNKQDEISDNLFKQMNEDARTFLKDYEKQRKQWVMDFNTACGDISRVRENFERTKRVAEFAKKSCDDARYIFEKVDRDDNATKKDVQRAKDDYRSKLTKSKESLEELEACYEGTVEKENVYYKEKLPSILRWMDDIEDNRVDKTKSLLALLTTFDIVKQSEISQIFETSSAKKCKELETTSVRSFVVNKYKSKTPAEFPTVANTFVPLPGMEIHDKASSSAALSLADDDVFMAPVEKLLRRGTKRIQELDAEIKRVIKKKEGIENLLSTYDNNPKFSDAKNRENVEMELEMVEKSILDLEKRKAKIIKLLESTNFSNSISFESDTSSIISGISKAPSANKLDTALKSIENMPDAAMKNLKISTESPTGSDEFQLCPNIPPPPPAANPAVQENVVKGIGQITALYSFQATEGSEELSLSEGEKLTVLEKEGSWWLVMNSEGKEGYIPCNYVQEI